MSDFCSHCDDLSIDASRARRTDNQEVKEKQKRNGSKPRKGNGNKITINVDSSDENADWIKQVRDQEVEEQSLDGADQQSDRDSHPKPDTPTRVPVMIAVA